MSIMTTTIKKPKKEKAPVESCDICCENFNKSNRKPVECPYCSRKCCLLCSKTYLSTIIKDPHCMHCKVGWNTAFIRSTFPSTWLSKEYRDIREKILFDLELAKIPDTQRFCDASVRRERAKHEREDTFESVKKIKDEIASLQKQYEECNQDIWILSEEKENDAELEQLKVKSHQLYLNMKNCNDNLDSLQEKLASLSKEINTLTHDIEGTERMEREDVGFYLACPKEKCKGFINKQWKCGLCNSRICCDCHEVKENMDIHRCDPDVKASVETLRKDSKPCPKCASLIHKISGCDQMWCTRCRTAFSWNTGNIEEAVHNPHFFEYMRTRDQQDVQNEEGQPNNVEQARDCNEIYVAEANTFSIVQKIRDKVTDVQQRNFILDMVRLLIHIAQSELPSMVPAHVRQIPHDPNRELRIKYMLNEITLEEFKSSLAKREKDRLKREEISQILQTFLQVADDLVWRFLENKKVTLESFLKEMEAIRSYTNECLRKIAEQYSCKVRCVSDTYENLITFEKKATSRKEETVESQAE